MSRALKIGLAIGGGVVLLAVIALFLIPVNQFRPHLEAQASAALGRKVDLGRLRLSIFSQSLSAETLAVADDPAFSKSPFLTAKAVKVGVRLWPLITSRSLDVTSIAIESPEVTLIRNAAGQWNYSSLGASSTLSDFSIKKLELKNGRIVTGSTTSRRRSTYDHVTIDVLDVSSASGSPVSATAAMAGGGGTFALSGTVGPLNHADASLTPFVGTFAVKHLNLATSGFLNPSAGLGGLLDLKVTITSKSDEAAVAGSATVSHAVLVAGGSPASEPMVIDFDTRYNLRTHSGVLNPSTLKIGGATARLHGTYNTRGDYTVVGLKVVGEHMPVRDV
ncbi:MAG TPA: AsmA family protein, partial [Vicinamibacterales bacterium]|nr:AsmA family protein [Vicinamibacterales bacterium]